MALQGSLSTMSVSDLLQFLAVSRKTGLLKFSQQKVRKGIYFENGIIVGSSTNDPREYLGQVLMHYGKIDEAQLQAAMEVQRGEAAFQRSEVGGQRSENRDQRTEVRGPSVSEVQSQRGNVPSSEFRVPSNQQREKGEGQSGEGAVQSRKSNVQSEDVSEVQSPKTKVQRPRRLGQILVADGILSQAQVSQLLEIRTLDIIYDLFLWKEGHFEFVNEGPLPPDFTRVHVEANRVVMEGIHRADEMARFRTLIPSDRTLLELGAGWTSSLPAGKATRQLLYFLEKRMSVAEICYNMHSSAFEVYAQLFELVTDGVVHVVGELPETPDPVSQMPDLPDAAADLLLLARSDLNNGESEKALSIIHTVLGRDPKNTAAHALLAEAEKKFIDRVYSEISPSGVPKVLVQLEELANKEIGSQEGFVLSRINGVWDIQSILSICPFREADSLSLIKKLWDNGIIGF
jgi:uncharacterized protein DUF4388